MERIFLSVYHMSITGGYLIAAVIGARFLLKKIPKNVICILWLIVGVRLICPFRIESAFSLLPDNQNAVFSSRTNNIPAGSHTVPAAAAPAGQLPAAGQQDQADLLPEKTGSLDAAQAAPYIWFAGMSLMCAYMVYTWHCIRKHVSTAIPDTFENMKFYRCSEIASPFLFGAARPKIYVPFSISNTEIRYVLKHELAHKSRFDHLLKPAGYLLLCVYWFHPLVWAAYILLCRDIELACDEKVIKDLGSGYKKAYSTALLNCSVNQKTTAAYPVAFGEIGVKKRVKNILNYKKPNFWAFLAAVSLCAAVTLCFATETKSENIQVSTDLKDTAANASPSDDYEKQMIQQHLITWAEAFCNRDGAALEQMYADNTGKESADSHSFGWSSPWPWGTDSDTAMKNYQILSVQPDSAIILYYAWTSDPHVTVWQQKLAYQYDSSTNKLNVGRSSTDLQFFDNISTFAEFENAYILGGISGKPIDYLTNNTGEALNRNAKNNKKSYEMLFQPQTAALYLLNITDDTSKVTVKTVQKEDGTYAFFTFLEDNHTSSVKMIQPYGTDGIWIPQ